MGLSVGPYRTGGGKGVFVKIVSDRRTRGHLDPKSKKPYTLKNPAEGLMKGQTTNLFFQTNRLIIMRLKNQSILISISLLLIGAVFISGCQDNESGDSSRSTPTSFTFLELGANTIYSKSVRSKLGNSLGSVAISKQTPIDLEINYPGFIEKYFNPIYRLDQILNDAAGARREHQTIRLMYRYPQKKSRLFKKVELLFSSQSKKPLFFKIVARKEGADIVDAMREKYGSPKETEWSHQPGVSYSWEKDEDLMVISRVLDRFGDPEYRIAIYYGTNINELIGFEQRQIKQSENTRKKAGRTAF
jgi:hypothetical protein